MACFNRGVILIAIYCLNFSVIHAQSGELLSSKQIELIFILRNNQFRKLVNLVKDYPNLDANFYYYDVDIKDVYKSDYGIDFSGKNAQDLMVTPLHKAALFSPTATSALLTIGADPNAGTEKLGYTPLHLLALADKSFPPKNIKASAQILANHATIDLFKRAAFIVDKKREQFSAPALAMSEHKKKLYEDIMTSYQSRAARAQAESPNVTSTLLNAIDNNQPETVEQILQDNQSIDVNASLNLERETFLHRAMLKDPRIAKALLAKGANPNAQMVLTGYTPLHLAALAHGESERTNAAEVVKELLQDERTDRDIKAVAGPFSQRLTPTELAGKEKNLPVLSKLRLAKVQKPTPSLGKRPPSEAIAPEAKKLKS